jgi:predicted transposase YbfD/YdcC
LATGYPPIAQPGIPPSKRELSDGTVTIQDHYFLYSLKDTTAGEIMEIKRSHWSIENNLHWVLDMTFREDESRMRIKHSAENINILRKLALELIKHETSVKGSIKSKRQRCAWDTLYAFKVLGLQIS